MLRIAGLFGVEGGRGTSSVLLLVANLPAYQNAEEHPRNRENNGLKFHQVSDDHNSVRLNQSTSERMSSGSRDRSAVPCATTSVSRISRVPGPIVLRCRIDRHEYGSFVLAASSAGLPAYFFIAPSVRNPR